MIRALLFDLYQTLAEPEWPLLFAGREALAREVGLEPAALLPHWQRTHQQRMRGAWGSLKGDLAEILSGVVPLLPDQLLHRLAEMELASWARGVRLYPEVLVELGRLRAAGYQLAIVSNASHEAASVIEGLGLDDCVDEVIVSCRVGSLKPEPAIFQETMERLGTPASQGLLVDDVAANLDGAKPLGIGGVLMDRAGAGPAPMDADAYAYPRVRSLLDLWPLLAGDPAPAPLPPAGAAR